MIGKTIGICLFLFCVFIACMMFFDTQHSFPGRPLIETWPGLVVFPAFALGTGFVFLLLGWRE